VQNIFGESDTVIPHWNNNQSKQEIIGQDRIGKELQKTGKGMTRKEPLGRSVKHTLSLH